QHLLPTGEELESLERVELLLRRDAEVGARAPLQILGEVLNDCAERELVQRTATGRAVAAPARALVRRREREAAEATRGDVDGQAQREGVVDAALDELARRIVETVDVFADQRAATQQRIVLELRQIGVVRGHEQRVGGRQRGDE